MAIARVGSQVVGGSLSSGATTIDLLMPSDVTSGNLIAVGAIGDNADVTQWSLAKQAGTATIGTPVRHITDTGSGGCACWTVEVTVTGSLTLRVSHASSTFWVAAAVEYSGADVSGTRLEDSDIASTTTSTSTPAITSMTSAGGALFFGVLQTYFSSNVAHTAGTGYSEVYEQQDGTAYMTGSIIDRIVTSGTSDEIDWTLGSAAASGSWSACGIVIKAGSSNGDVTGVVGTATASAPSPVVFSVVPGSIVSTVEL